MIVRTATKGDEGAIRSVHLRAFPTAAEADLVERLAKDGAAVISIVAEDQSVVGHVLLSRMRAEADGRELSALGLAPVAVVPEWQGQGIGSALIEAAIRDARTAGEEILFVLGEPGYYRRFGFDAGIAKPFASPYAGSYFQALLLTDLPPPTRGAADYPEAFGALE